MPEPQQTILFMRHPQTQANVDMLFSGDADVFLTPEGEKQRKRAMSAIVSWNPKRLFSSPLTRCLSIAAEAAEYLKAETVIDPRITEIDFGVLEGTSWPDYPDYPWPLDENGHSIPAEGAESYEHVFDRAKAFLEDLKPYHGRTAAICHGGFMRILLAAVYDSNPNKFQHMEVENVSSMILTCDGNEFNLAAFGLTPEEIMMRRESGRIFG